MNGWNWCLAMLVLCCLQLCYEVGWTSEVAAFIHWQLAWDKGVICFYRSLFMRSVLIGSTCNSTLQSVYWGWSGTSDHGVRNYSFLASIVAGPSMLWSSTLIKWNLPPTSDSMKKRKTLFGGIKASQHLETWFRMDCTDDTHGPYITWRGPLDEQSWLT